MLSRLRYENLTRVRTIEPIEHFHRRGFARAVLSDDRVDASLSNPKLNPRIGGTPPKVFVSPLSSIAGWRPFTQCL